MGRDYTGASLLGKAGNRVLRSQLWLLLAEPLRKRQKTKGVRTWVTSSDPCHGIPGGLFAVGCNDIEIVRLILRTLLYEEAIEPSTKHQARAMESRLNRWHG